MRYVRIGQEWRQALDFDVQAQGKMSSSLRLKDSINGATLRSELVCPNPSAFNTSRFALDPSRSRRRFQSIMRGYYVYAK
jgi:hypothetical protein